jgi:cytochrome c oxidase assembly protein subunit 15
MDILTAPHALRNWAIASLVANMGLIFTGGLVRVTSSGLGCPTWPQCMPGSYIPHAASGLHALIEFGNRTLTFVLAIIAVGTLVAAWKTRDEAGAPRWRARGLAIAAAAGIPAQAVIGGISVLSGLNPWVVGAHLIPSIALVFLSVVLVHEAMPVPPAPVPTLVRRLIWATFVLGICVLLAGAVVTGAGPNSGDGGAARNGLELMTVTRVHSGLVWLVVALTVVLVWLMRTNERVRSAVVLLLAVELVQGLIGYLQYALSLPPGMVAAHMLGTALFAAALANLWWLTRPGGQVSSGSSAAARNTIAR